VVNSPIEGYRSCYYPRISSYRPCPYLASPGALSSHTLAPSGNLPNCIELSPTRFSPSRDSVRYYPLNHSAHRPVDWPLEEAKRRAAEEESRKIEAEQRLRWAEEDKDREARRLKADQDRKNWEAKEKKRKQREDAENAERNRREQERRDKEKADRERDQNERRLREKREKEQRDKDLEERKRKTDELLRQKVKEDLENANKFKKSMPHAYDEPLIQAEKLGSEPPPQKKNKKKKSKLFISIQYLYQK